MTDTFWIHLNPHARHSVLLQQLKHSHETMRPHFVWNLTYFSLFSFDWLLIRHFLKCIFPFFPCIKIVQLDTSTFQKWCDILQWQVNIAFGKFIQYVTPSDPLSTWLMVNDKMLNCFTDYQFGIDRIDYNRIFNTQRSPLPFHYTSRHNGDWTNSFGVWVRNEFSLLTRETINT